MILVCKTELDMPGVKRERYGSLHRISERYMDRNEFSAELLVLSTAADSAMENFSNLYGEYPDASRGYAQVLYGSDHTNLDPKLVEMSVAVRETVAELDHFVIYYTPVDIDAFRLRIVKLSDTVSRSMQELRHLQAIGVDIGAAIVD